MPCPQPTTSPDSLLSSHWHLISSVPSPIGFPFSVQHPQLLPSLKLSLLIHLYSLGLTVSTPSTPRVGAPILLSLSSLHSGRCLRCQLCLDVGAAVPKPQDPRALGNRVSPYSVAFTSCLLHKCTVEVTGTQVGRKFTPQGALALLPV